MVTRSIHHELIRYILGTTGEGCQHLPDYPNTPLSWINYVLNDDDEVVTAWLLWDPVVQDPLELLTYCHRPNNVSREPPAELRGHHNLVPGVVTNWVNEPIAQEQSRGGSFHPEARRSAARANSGLAKEASQPQEDDDSDALLVALTGVTWDVSGAGDGHEGSIGLSSSSGRERGESPAKHIPLALKSSSRLNRQHSAELGRHPAQGLDKEAQGSV